MERVMEHKNKILSLRAFAKAAGISIGAVMYHVKQGHLTLSERVVKGVDVKELEKIPKIVKRVPQEKLSTARP